MEKAPLLLALSLAIATAACAPARPGPGPTGQALPPFTQADAQLFDDAFAPEVLGTDVASGSDLLRQRARAADGAVPCRVTTVSRTAGEGGDYLVEVVPVEPALKGPAASGSLGLTVVHGSPSYPLVRSLDTGLVGARLVLFYKRFSSPEAEVLHWHAEADTLRVRQTAQSAALLGEMRR